MDLARISSIASRGAFFGAFALAAIAVFEYVVQLFGYTLLRGTYKPGRLVEFAAILLIFVIALLLRSVREELRSSRGAGS